ncbi:MAG: hypothetical protein U5K71_00025 [Gracilimonas sp.]|nr:hypothetical protein [Gracilimonas sp.]
MRLFIRIVVLWLGISSCTQPSETPDKNIPATPALDIIDIRIYEDGRTYVNGKSTNYSAIPGLMQSMNISEQTLARFIFVMGEQTPLVYETTRLLQQHGTFNIKKIILPQAEFYTYLEQNIHIDILTNGRVLLDGNELFVEDITVALKAPGITPDKTIIFTLPENFSKSALNRSVQILDSLGFNSIKYADLTEY